MKKLDMLRKMVESVAVSDSEQASKSLSEYLKASFRDMLLGEAKDDDKKDDDKCDKCDKEPCECDKSDDKDADNKDTKDEDKCEKCDKEPCECEQK